MQLKNQGAGYALMEYYCHRGWVVYKIPYRHARAWPIGCIGYTAFRPSARASKGIMYTRGWVLITVADYGGGEVKYDYVIC